MGLLTNILNTLRLSYDPVRDYDDRIPVRGRQTTTKFERTATATTDSDDVHEASDGKLYGRQTTTNDSGATVYVLDSTDIRTGTNVKPYLTKYDLYVFGLYEQQAKYKHFDLELFRLIKAEAFSKSENGKPIKYRAAAELPKLKSRKGCGQRYMSNYFKALNEAFQMEQSGAPIPESVGVAV